MQHKLLQAKTMLHATLNTAIKHSKEASALVERTGCVGKLKNLVKKAREKATQTKAQKTGHNTEE